MPQKPLEQEKIEQARELRRQGKPIEAIASELGISVGAASKHTRGIQKPIRAPVVKPGGGKKPGEGKGIMDKTGEAALDDETRELANRVRRARLQGELDEIEDRRGQRERLVELGTRERELRLQLDEARGKAATGDSSVNEEIRELRQHLNDLGEERHRQEIYQMESRHQADMQTLQRQIAASANRTGLTSYDLIAQGMGKLENMAMVAGSKVDSFMRDNRRGKELGMALSLGLSPGEYETLLRGPDTPFTKAQWQALVGGGSLTPSDIEGYERHLANMEKRNAQYEAIMAKVAQRLGQGRQPEVTLAGRQGHAPAPGEPEPPVLKAESRLVTCSRCQTTFDIDLREVRQHVEPGKSLFVACANPKCEFLLDLSELLGLKVAPKGPAPECYSGTGEGCASKGLYAQCQDCQYRDFARQVYE